MLAIQDLSRPGLQPVSMELADGACLGLAGPSGSGKTLFLRALADLDPASGRVALDGVSRDAMPAPEWRRRVGYLPPESGWWEETVGPHFTGDGTADLIARLGFREDPLPWPVARLSTGEKQRLALARLLLNRPRVLLLDEPTSGLDGAGTRQVEALIKERLADGVSVLLVSHDPAQLGRMAARVLRIEDGLIREEAA